MDDLFYHLNPRTIRIMVILLILTIVVAASMAAPWLFYQYPPA
jgi:hypothetical protein